MGVSSSLLRENESPFPTGWGNPRLGALSKSLDGARHQGSPKRRRCHPSPSAPGGLFTPLSKGHCRWPGSGAGSTVQIRDDRGRKKERRERTREGGGGGRLEEKEERKVGEAFVKLKGKAPSDGVGQGKRVAGGSNW